MVDQWSTSRPAVGTDLGGVLLADSVTALDRAAGEHVVVCGSHGGRFAAVLAAQHRVRAIVLNDAGVGLDRAGTAGLDLLAELGLAAATASHTTARIGDARDCFEHGLLSHVNSPARALGCRPGMSVREAARLLAGAPLSAGQPPHAVEGRYLLEPGPPRVWALDSASLASVQDDGDVIVTGSHGRLLGGRPETALRATALAAVFNDAGDVEGCRRGRLAALDERGVAAAVVHATSARIGDARSSYYDGVVSAVNGVAAALGARPEQPTRTFVDLLRRRPADPNIERGQSR